MTKKITKMFHPFSIVLFLFFLYPTIFHDRAAGNTDYMEALSIIKPAGRTKVQNFILRDLNGTKVRLEDHRGKIVFLNFWATWCPPCRIEMPSMEKLYTHFKNKWKQRGRENNGVASSFLTEWPEKHEDNRVSSWILNDKKDNGVALRLNGPPEFNRINLHSW